MSDLLQDLPVGQISWGALVALVVLLILRGRLVTRQQLLDVIADRDHWRDTATAMTGGYHELGMAVHDLVRAVDRLTALGEASNHALTEIQSVLERPGGPAE